MTIVDAPHQCRDSLPAPFSVPDKTIARCDECGRYWRRIVAVTALSLLHPEMAFLWVKMGRLSVWWNRKRGRIPAKHQ